MKEIAGGRKSNFTNSANFWTLRSAFRQAFPFLRLYARGIGTLRLTCPKPAHPGLVAESAGQIEKFPTPLLFFDEHPDQPSLMSRMAIEDRDDLLLGTNQQVLAQLLVALATSAGYFRYMSAFCIILEGDDEPSAFGRCRQTRSALAGLVSLRVGGPRTGSPRCGC